MKFDWVRFLEQEGIEYVDSGKNVAKGNVNIQCPWCGESDHGYHLGIHLERGWYACWRDRRHRSNRPERLIAVLRRCSLQDAKALLQDEAPPSDFEVMKRKLAGVKESHEEPWQDDGNELALPHEFRKFDNTSKFERRFLHYLEDRGFHDPHDLARYYRLHYCLTGKFANRIIIPLDLNGRVVAWTGRAITKARLRYSSYPRGPILRHLLGNHGRAVTGGEVLAVVEGPFDWLKVDWYGKRHGLRAVALLGLSLTPPRMRLLAQLAPCYRSLTLLLDAAALAQAMDAQAQLATLGTGLAQVGAWAEDPGGLAASQVGKIARKLGCSQPKAGRNDC